MFLRTGDIFLVHGDGFVSNAIRHLTRRPGEKRGQISHVGIITDSGPMYGEHPALAVEALFSGVRRGPFYLHLGERLSVYRPINLSPEEIDSIRLRAIRYVGRRYGFMKILTHALDGLLFGAYVFRRLSNVDAWPICSWLVAHAYLAAGLDFGVPARAATPDDIDDFIQAHPECYACVMSLGVLK
jgi:hypothetical protein